MRHAEMEVCGDGPHPPNSMPKKREMNRILTFGELRDVLYGRWYSENVIDAYMGMLYSRRVGMRNKTNVPSLAILGCNFYPKFVAEGFEGIVQFLRNVVTISADLVLMPVCMEPSKHWILGVIDGQAMAVTIYCSLRLRLPEVRRNIQAFMVADNAARNNAAFRLSDWTFNDAGQGPQQTNGYDSGMFVCLAAEQLTRGMQPTKKKTKTDILRPQHVVELLACELFYK